MYDTGQDSGDGRLTEWLAARTQTDPEQIEAELQLGERRRAVVVDELVAAGLAGSELLEQVMGLTGLDAAGARARTCVTGTLKARRIRAAAARRRCRSATSAWRRTRSCSAG